MRADRLTRVNELLRREIGQFLFRLMQNRKFDVGAVTVTHVFVSSDLRTARVMVSIRDHVDQRASMLAMLNREHAAIQEHLAGHVILKYTPRLLFELDRSLEEGDHVLGVLAKLEKRDAVAPQDMPPEGQSDCES